MDYYINIKLSYIVIAVIETAPYTVAGSMIVEKSISICKYETDYLWEYNVDGL